jgi:hypothetical protein
MSNWGSVNNFFAIVDYSMDKINLVYYVGKEDRYSAKRDLVDLSA